MTFCDYILFSVALMIQTIDIYSIRFKWNPYVVLEGLAVILNCCTKLVTSQLNSIFPEVATPNLQEVMKYDLVLDTDKLVLT